MVSLAGIVNGAIEGSQFKGGGVLEFVDNEQCSDSELTSSGSELPQQLSQVRGSVAAVCAPAGSIHLRRSRRGLPSVASR